MPANSLKKPSQALRRTRRSEKRPSNVISLGSRTSKHGWTTAEKAGQVAAYELQGIKIRRMQVELDLKTGEKKTQICGRFSGD